jgi:hypothetical protein
VVVRVAIGKWEVLGGKWEVIFLLFHFPLWGCLLGRQGGGRGHYSLPWPMAERMASSVATVFRTCMLLLAGASGAPPFPKGAAIAVNISSPAMCGLATDICSCSALAPGCGWCSKTGTCAPADMCTTTCRECPSSHKSCRSSCRRKCIDTCAFAPTVCGCTELPGCGWCSHSNRCQPYPECSTTCEECNGKCANHKKCLANCYTRFHAPRRESSEDSDLTFPPSRTDAVCAFAIFMATVLASAAGIGGGAVLVPLFTLLGEFTEHEAIPLSIATVFGASLSAHRARPTHAHRRPPPPPCPPLPTTTTTPPPHHHATTTTQIRSCAAAAR